MSTLKDIAKLANTSVGTVSLALNGSPLVKLETRYRIQQIAKELDYHPNQYARSLVTKETKVVALFRSSRVKYPLDDTALFASNLDTLVLTMLPVIQNRIRRDGYSVLVDSFTPAPTKTNSNPIFNSSTIDGAFFFGGMITEAQLEVIRSAQIPSVLICARDDSVDFVDTDPKEGIRLAVQHLVEHGHRKIALINGAEQSQASAQKLAGYRLSLKEHGIPENPGLEEFTDFSGVSVWAAMDHLSSRGLEPTAFIGGTDYIACAILRYLQKKGLNCPQDISIVGYENSTPAVYSTPAITSISIHKNKLGEEAANILLNRIKNPKARHVGLIIPPRLVVRDSVASI